MAVQKQKQMTKSDDGGDGDEDGDEEEKGEQRKRAAGREMSWILPYFPL